MTFLEVNEWPLPEQSCNNSPILSCPSPSGQLLGGLRPAPLHPPTPPPTLCAIVGSILFLDESFPGKPLTTRRPSHCLEIGETPPSKKKVFSSRFVSFFVDLSPFVILRWIVGHFFFPVQSSEVVHGAIRKLDL